MSTELRHDARRRRESSTPCTCAEFAGVTAADCAAVMCCFPCGLLNILVAFAYKLPRAICRRSATSRRRRRAVKKMGSVSRVGSDLVYPVGIEVGVGDEGAWGEEEVRRVEKEMWESFYGTGFWRSPSQKDLNNNNNNNMSC